MASGRPLAGHGSAGSRDTLIAERIEGLVGQAHARGPPASSSRLTPRARQQAGTDPRLIRVGRPAWGAVRNRRTSEAAWSASQRGWSSTSGTVAIAL